MVLTESIEVLNKGLLGIHRKGILATVSDSTVRRQAIYVFNEGNFHQLGPLGRVGLREAIF